MSMASMQPLEWLTLIALGGLLGMLGQGARVVVGLKKAGDDSAAKGEKLSDNFQTSQLMMSLLIGFIAGSLGALALPSNLGAGGAVPPASILTTDQVVAIIAIGYAGTDFIEGFMRSKLPAATPAAPVDQAPMPPAMG